MTKGKRRDPDPCPALSPRAEAAIMRLAELLGRQIARELHEEKNRQREQKDDPGDSHSDGKPPSGGGVSRVFGNFLGRCGSDLEAVKRR
ncbi:hypothetical protein ACFSUK_31915 [Sphingobium scionense]